MPSEKPMIEAQDLHFRYDPEAPNWALDGESMEVRRGEFVAVLGANGCGKSTLAKHFNAILLPEKGTVLVEGMDTRTEEKLYDIRQKAGMVFQNPDNQIVATIVEEDVAFALENLGVPTDEMRARVDEAMKMTGIYEYREKAPHKLSGGQKQRVAIAGVMAMEPRILVLDEPAAGLDPEGRDTILSQIRNYHKKTGVTVVLVSHSMEDIAKYADKVLVMHRAKVAMYDTVEKVFARAPELLELGLSVPQVTQIFLKLREMGLDIQTDVYTMPYAVKTVLKAWNARHPDKPLPLPVIHGEGGNGDAS